MEGRQEASAQLFHDFDLVRHCPGKHTLREIDLFLEADSVRETLRPFSSHLGRPLIDPELIIRILVIGSERRLGYLSLLRHLPYRQVVRCQPPLQLSLLWSGEYPRSAFYPADLRNRGKAEQRTFLTQGR